MSTLSYTPRVQVKALVAMIVFYTLFNSLVGCGQLLQPSTPEPFAQFCGLTLDRFLAIDEKGLRQWVRNNFVITYPSHTLRRYSDDEMKAVVYTWDLGEAFLFDGRLAALVIRTGTYKEITLGQVVNRLGPPRAISTSTLRMSNGIEYVILLDYIDQGFLIGASFQVQPNATAVKLTEDIRVEGILCFVPGSVETLKRLDRAYDPGLRSWIDWPGWGVLMPID
ncbi:MAG: hypothetical protein ACP5NB_12825 [Chloroflexia bacterium]